MIRTVWTPRQLALLLALLLPVRMAAQSCNAPVPSGTCTALTSTSLTIPDVMQLTLTTTSTPLTAPTTAQYDAGYVADNGPTATIKSNRAWRLQISAGAATWTASNTVPGVNARTNKPAGDLQWGTAGGGPFTGLSVTPATATSGSATGGTPQSFFLRTLYSWGLDTPGAYSLAVIFTLIAP